MNIANPSNARDTFADRNGTTQTIFYQASGVAPHTLTTRSTYTVPAGKKSQVTRIRLAHIRSTVATTVGKVQALLSYVPAVAAGLNLALVQAIATTVGAGDELNSVAFDVLLAGDTIRLQTVDASTGGAIDYDLGVVLIEYDA